MIIKNFSDEELKKIASKDVLIKNVFYGSFKGALIFREEFNKWVDFFEKKGFWSERLKKRILGSSDWYGFYSIINELKLGYFLEKKLGINIVDYEPITVNDKKVEFKGKAGSHDYYIELKTKIEKNKRKSGSFNASDKTCYAFAEAQKQFLPITKNILFISNDLEVSLLDDVLAQNTVYDLLKQDKYKNISAVCLFGDIYIGNMYKLLYAINKYAINKISPNIFRNNERIYRF